MDSPGVTDSPSYERNPSPPPEMLEHADLFEAERIGDTIFSKHWLFTTLMKLIEEVDKENEVEEERELVVDIDEELQNELCKLWDMSMNSEVAVFLNEFKAVEILTGIVSKSKAPRVTEICVGILGNMACETTVCNEMVENQKFLNMMLDLLESRDVPSLVETTRLMYTSLSNTGAQGSWVKAIQRSEEFLQHVTFIFSSSTNCDLLKNTAELVDRLLDLENDLCVSWATEEFIQSLLEATDQIGSNHSAALEVYLNIFQSFSTTEPGVEALVSHRDRLGKKIMKYLNIVCEYEIVGLGGKEGPLASALSVLNILMNTQTPDYMVTLCKDEQLIRILLKILEPLYPILNHIRSDSEDIPPHDAPDTIEHTEDIDTDTSSAKVNSKSIDSAMEQVTETNTGSDQVRETNTESSTVNSVSKDGTVEQATDDTGSATIVKDISIKDNAKDHDNEVNGDVNDENINDGKEEMDDGEDDSPKDSGYKFDDLGEDEIQALTVLHDVLSGFLLEYCKLVFKYQHTDDLKNKPESSKDYLESKLEPSNIKENHVETKEKQSETEERETSSESKLTEEVTENEVTGKGDNQPNLCSSVLTYLESACSRSRINYLGLILKETSAGCALFEELMEMSKEFEKERLVRILNDVNNYRIVSRAESRKVSDEKE